eukprot:m.169956 g.169956  ORF g.169956 m.169956 type:complete len:128 (+) comp24183_c1_seq1:551-934(+)
MACSSKSRIPRNHSIEGSQHDYQCSHTSCPVCLDDLDIFARNKHEKVVVLRPCKHTFHRQCIKQWFIAEMRRGKPILSCPLCRTEIVPKQSVVIKYSSKVYNAVFRRGKRTSSDPETPSDVVNALLF